MAYLRHTCKKKLESGNGFIRKKREGYDTASLLDGFSIEGVAISIKKRVLIVGEGGAHMTELGKRLQKARTTLQLSQEYVPLLYHKLTVIHPFGAGNGRTLRAFMNLLFIWRGLPPIYFKVKDKDVYLDVLSQVDQDDTNYGSLYEVIFKAILRAQAELTETPPL